MCDDIRSRAQEVIQMIEVATQHDDTDAFLRQSLQDMRQNNVRRVLLVFGGILLAWLLNLGMASPESAVLVVPLAALLSLVLFARRPDAAALVSALTAQRAGGTRRIYRGGRIIAARAYPPGAFGFAATGGRSDSRRGPGRGLGVVSDRGSPVARCLARVSSRFHRHPRSSDPGRRTGRMGRMDSNLDHAWRDQVGPGPIRRGQTKAF